MSDSEIEDLLNEFRKLRSAEVFRKIQTIQIWQ